jgi:prepilin-type N-terminal cleavage/methylation domain-containing protein
MSNKLDKKGKGFTIIEVMIVLAIAGLIMLVVFLAVPNLQRSSRNNGRKADVGRIGTAATNFVANSNGTLPSATVAGDGAKIITDAGTLSQYPSFAEASPLGTAAANKLSIVAGAASVGAISVDGMQLVTGAKCGASGAATSTGASARSMALQYAQETSGGFTGACQDI